MTPLHHQSDRAPRTTTAPLDVPMAPIAGPGPALAAVPRRQRRAWWRAAVTTGVLLAPAHAVAAPGLAQEVPTDLLVAAAEVALDGPAIGPWDGVVDAWTAPTATAGVAAPAGPWASHVRDVRSPAPTSDEREGRGALPDGVTEFARYGDVALVAEGSSLELVGFHEAADPAALELAPTGHVVDARHDEDRGPLVTLPTRHRGTAPTSSVDLAMRVDEPVLAPVTGEIVQVAEFALYGSTTDVLVEIRPDDDPGILVKVLHVADPSVAVGDRVEAGASEIAATARQLPFESQIDSHTALHRGAAAPHVHIELRRTVHAD